MLEPVGGVTPEWLAATLLYTSRVDGRTGELPRAVAAIHLFNHGTPHRSQLTTLIRQAGRDPGVTDLPWLPGIVRILESRPRRERDPPGEGKPGDFRVPCGAEGIVT